MTEICQKDDRKMSECQNYWHTEWLTSMGKTAPPWGRRPVPEEDNHSSTKSICPHESFVFWEIVCEFTHPNSSFEYVSDFSNFVFGDVVLFSKCLSHDFFTFSFAFCFFSQPLLVFPFDCSIDKRFVFILCEVGRIYIRNIQSFADFFCFLRQARPSFFSLFIVDFVCQGSPFQASYVKEAGLI